MVLNWSNNKKRFRVLQVQIDNMMDTGRIFSMILVQKKIHCTIIS